MEQRDPSPHRTYIAVLPLTTCASDEPELPSTAIRTGRSRAATFSGPPVTSTSWSPLGSRYEGPTCRAIWSAPLEIPLSEGFQGDQGRPALGPPPATSTAAAASAPMATPTSPPVSMRKRGACLDGGSGGPSGPPRCARSTSADGSVRAGSSSCSSGGGASGSGGSTASAMRRGPGGRSMPGWDRRSEEHTSELQSRQYLVCRL